MALIDEWSIPEIFASVGGLGAIIIAFVAIVNNRGTKNVIKTQNKLYSATLSLELIKRMRENDFSKIVNQIFDKETVECDRPTLERFLNHLDLIAKFYEDGLIDLDHVTQIYGGLIRRIMCDETIRKIIYEDPRLFKPLKNLHSEIRQ